MKIEGKNTLNYSATFPLILVGVIRFKENRESKTPTVAKVLYSPNRCTTYSPTNTLSVADVFGGRPLYYSLREGM